MNAHPLAPILEAIARGDQVQYQNSISLRWVDVAGDVLSMVASHQDVMTWRVKPARPSMLAPWTIRPSTPQDGVECFMLVDSTGDEFGSINGPQNAQQEARAALASSAPDLLEALTTLLPILAEWHAGFPRDVGDKEGPAIQAAEAAIAKATGAVA